MIKGNLLSILGFTIVVGLIGPTWGYSLWNWTHYLCTINLCSSIYFLREDGIQQIKVDELENRKNFMNNILQKFCS